MPDNSAHYGSFFLPVQMTASVTTEQDQADPRGGMICCYIILFLLLSFAVVGIASDIEENDRTVLIVMLVICLLFCGGICYATKGDRVCCKREESQEPISLELVSRS